MEGANRSRSRQGRTLCEFLGLEAVGLSEQGSLPRRTPTSPFFDDEKRRELDTARGARLQRPDAASRDRYLFYTACTRISPVKIPASEGLRNSGASKNWEK